MKPVKRPLLALFAALGLLVSACAHTEIREVKIPIPVPCVTVAPTRPASAFEGVPPDAMVFDSVQALLIDRERMGAYVGEVEALLEACK